MTQTGNISNEAAVDAINQSFEEKEAQSKAVAAGLEYINLAKFPLNPDILHLIDCEKAKALQLVPFYRNGYKLKLAVVNPGVKGLDFLRSELEAAQFEVELAVCSARSFNQVLDLYHSDLVNRKTIELQHDFAENEASNLESKFVSFGELEINLKTLPAAEALNAIEIIALQVKASDIHVQPAETAGMLRFRIDGILHDIAKLSLDRAQKLVNHIKYEAGMKSNISHIPQDGSLSFVANGRKVDLRVSTLPTEWLESVVMRILDSRKGLKSFADLGFDAEVKETITRALRRKSGMVLVTGPTGSGKTTTLYAMLKQLNDPDKKLVSLEDPVEYHLDGVTQSPVDEQSDYTFANGLKALLRHDPDVILIGEIREGTTAKLASEAALTGHVVLSSLHTNSALGAISRLRNLGLESFNIASAINAIFAQRLVRRVCPHCAKKQLVDLAEHKRVADLITPLKAKYPTLPIDVMTTKAEDGVAHTQLELPQPDGCVECSHTGYLGQTVICETLWFTDELRAAIGRGEDEQTLKKTIENQGTLFSDGLRKALLGETTLDEVYRVAG